MPGHRQFPRYRRRRLIPMWRRSELVPPAWRVVDDSGADSFGRSPGSPGTRALELWRLCLEAKNIPHLVIGFGDMQRIFVPPLWEGIARTDIAAVSAEGRLAATRPRPGQKHAWWILLFLALLGLWHSFIMGWWPVTFEHMPEPEYFLNQGMVDVYKARMQAQWWRAATALTLHSDSDHLLGNLLFAVPFLWMLARRMGPGLALSMSVLSGILGNVLNIFYRPFSHTSVGFSTVLFGIIGILCADYAVRDSGHGFKNRAFLPLAVGLGLLAMLGTEGARTDYAAHIFGLLAGFVLGALGGRTLDQYGPPPAWLNLALSLATPALLFWAWSVALA